MGAEFLGDGDGKAAAQPHAEAQHHKVQRAGGPHPRQGTDAQELTHDHRVHNVVELLEQHAQIGGKGEIQNELQGRALC